jgi:predicted NBD/HSP70 family sugar kinase
MSRSTIGNSELISTVNNRLILQAVRVMQPTFRAAVARRTGLKPATVTVIVNELIDQRMLREVAGTTDGGSTRFGRPPLMLEVNADARRILAIDLEPDRIRVALTNLLAEVLEYREQPIDRFDAPGPVLADIVNLCRDVLRSTNRKQLHGIGVSLPGLIDQERGVLLSSTNMPKWRDVPIARTLEKELRAPVTVDRSLHLAALYEMWSNPQHMDRDVLIISLRTGVGMSLLNRGQLYRGSRGLSGEIGHCIVDINGRPCECGSRGCLETFVSASAICARGREMIKEGKGHALADALRRKEPLTPELIYRLGRDGDPDCAGIVRDVGGYIGIAVANMINLLSPDEVVICGAIDTAEDLILAAVQEQIKHRALPRSRENVVVRLAEEKEKLPLLGAAVLIAQDVFELPSLRHVGGLADDDGRPTAITPTATAATAD